jgi:hypothetical protein
MDNETTPDKLANDKLNTNTNDINSINQNTGSSTVGIPDSNTKQVNLQASNNLNQYVDTGNSVITTSKNDTSKKSVATGVIVLLFLIILGAGGFYLYMQYSTPKQSQDQQLTNLPPVINQPTQPLTTPTILPTKLETYTDKVNGYAIDYPSDFILADYQEGDYQGISLTYLGEGQVRPQSELVDGIVIKTLVITDNSEDLEGYVIAQKAKEADSDEITVSDISQVLMSDRAGYQYTISGQGDYRVIYVENGGKFIRITTNIQAEALDLADYQKKTEEIINTITFTTIAEDDSQTPTGSPTITP